MSSICTFQLEEAQMSMTLTLRRNPNGAGKGSTICTVNPCLPIEQPTKLPKIRARENVNYNENSSDSDIDEESMNRAKL